MPSPHLTHADGEVHETESGRLVGRKLDGWGYLFNLADGRLVSEGTIIAEPLPAGFGLLERPARTDPVTTRWNEEERRPMAYRDEDRLTELRRQIAMLGDEVTRLEG